MSQNKKKILIFIDWYLPAYKAGGPVRSVANMIARLKYDFEFRIVTSDRDLNDNHPFGGITINEWSTATDGTAVIYLGPDKQNYQTIRKIIQEERADFIYLNSLFSKKFTLLPLVVRKKHFPHRKVILACRGMLGAGSMQNKKLKKMLFLATARIWGLYKNIRWQSTSELESKEITDMFGKHISISLVPNLSDPTITVVNPTSAKAKGSLRMLYIGRISPVKNLELLLKILSHIPPEGEVILDVYGAIDDESYWSQC